MYYVVVWADIDGGRVTFRHEQPQSVADQIATSEALRDALRAYVGSDCAVACETKHCWGDETPLADWEKELLTHQG